MNPFTRQPQQLPIQQESGTVSTFAIAGNRPFQHDGSSRAAMYLSLLVAFLGGLAGTMEWRRLARRHSDLTIENATRRGRHVLLTIPIALALLAIQLTMIGRPDFAWALPFWLELHYTTLLFAAVMACFGFVFGLATYGAIRTAHRRVGLLVAVALLALGTVVVAQWRFTEPISASLRARENQGVVLQSSPASCAAASAANLVRQFGLSRSEPEMAELLGTTRYGTSPAQVVAGLSTLGFVCKKETHATSDASSVRLPAVLFYPPRTTIGVGHAVLLVAVDEESVVVLDPLQGRLVLPTQELSARWTGNSVECEPPAGQRPSGGPREFHEL